MSVGIILLLTLSPSVAWHAGVHKVLLPHGAPRCTLQLASPRVSVREAEDGFVDHENLEDGEDLISALKAFDQSGTCLCAGALLRRHSETAAVDVHECWLADSIERGVGPNLQVAGAAAVLDALFLVHHDELAASANATDAVTSFVLHVGDGLGATSAVHAAALSRGFVREASCADTAESVLLFDPAVGVPRYQSVCDGEADDEMEAMASDGTADEHRRDVSTSVASRLLRALRDTPRFAVRLRPASVLQEHEQGTRARVGRSGGVMMASSGTGPLTQLRRASQQAVADLNSDSWEPWRPPNRWRNPCFLSSFLTALSVGDAARRGLFRPFGVGPLLVLLSSVLYWHKPVKESVRRTIDLTTVRWGMAAQVLLAWRYCEPRALPLLLSGYAVGGACYAAGRIQCVRGRVLAGHLTHCGVHVFANLGNLLILPFAIR